MLKKKNFLNNKNKISPATLLNPVYTNKTTNERDEQSEYLAIYETKKKPKPKITEHKHVFG
jgi:hypothetical protein